MQNMRPMTQQINSVDLGQSPQALLASPGWYYLKEVFQVLDPEQTGKYKLAFKQINRIIEKEGDPFEIMGRAKLGGRVVVLMERFAPWYQANPIFRAHRLDQEMNFTEFLGQRGGYFRLSEVCRQYGDFLPYSYNVLKRMTDRTANSQEKMGLLKSDTTYLVAMPAFERWLKSQILG